MEIVQYPAKIAATLRLILWPKVTDEDVVFIRAYLNKQEQILFYAQTTLDQRHALNVAYAIRDLLGRRPKLHQDKLYKAALLHDIGKARARLRLLDRIWQVLFFTCLPPLANYLADRGSLWHKAYWRRILYACKYHPRIGAELARDIKVEEGVVYLIEHHCDPAAQGEPAELTILREADELN
ncbi:MAG: HD domain-containing protein [Candidatus Margulisbacteria bacterium]|jgi:putative nucleotidyltransferase with HDIG domain|nr:HD domain-containing protein [Candidatus Margulisiibacteriota bacterium]